MVPCIVIQYQIKVQLDATVCSLIYFTAKSRDMFRVSQHPSSGEHKTVTTASVTVQLPPSNVTKGHGGGM